MREYVSKRYKIRVSEDRFPPDGSRDKKGWTFDTNVSVLKFLDGTNYETLQKLLDRFGIVFLGGNDGVDEEMIVNIIFADSQAQELIEEVKKLQEKGL